MVTFDNTRGLAAFRAGLFAVTALTLTGCANEPVNHHASFAPMMMLSGAALLPETQVVTAVRETDAIITPIRSLSHQSLAAKVLASRALETVTGFPIDPARLSEHD